MLSVDHHGNSSVIPGSHKLTGPWTNNDSDRPHTTATGPAEPEFLSMAMGAGRGEMSVVFVAAQIILALLHFLVLLLQPRVPA